MSKRELPLSCSTTRHGLMVGGWACVCVTAGNYHRQDNLLIAFTTVEMCVFNFYWDLCLMGNGLHDSSREEHCLPSHLGIFPLFLCLSLSPLRFLQC